MMSYPMSVVAGKPTVSTGEQGITWAPVQAPSKLNFIGTSFPDVVFALSAVWGGTFPIRLTREDLPILRGMAAAAGEGNMPYTELLRALTQFGSLEVCIV